MKRPLLLLPLLLAGCASNAAQDTVARPPAAAALSLTWLQPRSLEVALDGKRYAGEWTGAPCLNEYCRGVYRNVSKYHRRHIDKGSATLQSRDGERLVCTWVSHLPEVRGTCSAPDGRQFRLTAG